MSDKPKVDIAPYGTDGYSITVDGQLMGQYGTANEAKAGHAWFAVQAKRLQQIEQRLRELEDIVRSEVADAQEVAVHAHSRRKRKEQWQWSGLATGWREAGKAMFGADFWDVPNGKAE